MPTMVKKDNLLDSTGIDWFRQKVIGGYLLYNGRVCKLMQIVNANTILALSPDGREQFLINKKDIAGFGALAYPQLGYRRMFGRLATYIERNAGGHGQGRRGLRPNSVEWHFSTASDVLFTKYERHFRGPFNNMEEQLMTAVFKPEYDTPDMLDTMLAGDKLQVILNHNVLIEPSVAEEDEDYVVYFRRRACGRFNERKEFKWYSNEYKQAVLPLLNNYGVHK